MKIIGIMLCILIVLLWTIYRRLNNSVAHIQRLDKEGGLYYGEYVKDYDHFLCKLLLPFISGCHCSAFVTKNEKKESITGRNYDMPHFNKEKQITGLNMVLSLHPKGKYASINGVDVCWLSAIHLPFYKGALDTKISKWPLAFLPYLCMDGINEKGLTVSILALDLKQGETPACQNEKNKKKVNVTYLLRLLLDNCSDLKQARAFIENCNMVATLKCDYHIFVSDQSGKSMVVEWRYNKTKFIESDIVTNFYEGQDDACDCYYGEDLKEKFKKTRCDRPYHYGYGHGYGRFNKLVNEISKHRIKEDAYDSCLSDKQAFNLLSKVAQDYDGMLTSYTQYSVLYNSQKRSATYALWQDYANTYTFKIK